MICAVIGEIAVCVVGCAAGVVVVSLVIHRQERYAGAAERYIFFDIPERIVREVLLPDGCATVYARQTCEIVVTVITGLSVMRIKRISDRKLPQSAVRIPCQICLLYTSPSPRDLSTSRMPSSA